MPRLLMECRKRLIARTAFAIFATVLGPVRPVHAQVYPCNGPGPGEVMVGTSGGGNGVAPTPLCRSVDSGSQAQQNTPRWQSQWMAIAADMQKQRMGTSTHDITEQSARTGAVVDCKRHGGENCEVQITVRNGCAAMVAGAKSTYAKAADRQDDAEAIALMQCNGQDTQCMKLYSGCSPAVQVE